MSLIRKAPRAARRGSPEAGFTLLETMIAMVVFAIGVLGLTGLQTMALRANHSANMRSHASILAVSILDQMRANKVAVAAGQYDTVIGATPSTPAKDCSTQNCSTTELAAHELHAWKQAITASFPNGDGAVSRAGNLVTVTVQWDDSRGIQPPLQFVTSTEI